MAMWHDGIILKTP